LALLFIDSTYDLTIGLLSDKYQWLDFRVYKNQKASALLQQECFNLCASQKLKFSELKGAIALSGPGFYTGLRLSEGFLDVVSHFNIPCYSFYSYEVPSWCGHDELPWVTKAYRGEYFYYSNGSAKLVSAKDLPAFSEAYIHIPSAIDEVVVNKIAKPHTTHELIRLKPELIFSQVIGQNLKRDSYYFRAPEDEFRVSV